MRKNYFYLIILILSTFFSFGQKVTLTPTTVNGSNFGSGAVNLGSTPYSTITLNVKVELPDGAAAGDQGTLKVYFSKGTGLGSNVAIGGDGGSLYFGGGKVASKSFTISLSWGDFPTSGAYLYAEYKNIGSFNSSDVPIIKNSTMNGGTLNPPADAPNPNQISNTLCCNQTVREGDKPALINGSTYNNPYMNYSYGLGSSWVAGSSIANYDNYSLQLDYITKPGNFTVARNIGYNYYMDKPNKSNITTITVVPSPILTNEISVVAPIDPNGFFEITDTNPKQITGTRQSSQVNLTILQNPSHTSQRGDSFTEIEKFDWEYTKTNSALGGTKNWITINGENDYLLKSFSPTNISTMEDNYYLLRRIAVYQNIKRVSNTLKIVLRTIRNNNTICCDQTLVISASNTIEQPTPFIGSNAAPDSNGYLKYQWQSQSIDNNTGKLDNWVNINGATSRDYLPPSLQLVSKYDPRTRGNIWTTLTSYNYRRLTVPQYYNDQSSYSNEVNLSAANYIYLTPNPITVYPNPASSIINIQNNGTTFILNNTPITIVNMVGVTVVSPNNFSIINPNLMSVDISTLPIGTYFIVINLGGNRSNTTAFFKNN